MKRAALFDMDGVLLDSAPWHFQSWMEWARRHDVTLTEEDFQNQFGRTNREILPALLGRALSEEEILRHTEEKESLYRDRIRGQARPLPGLESLIQSLAGAGWRLAVASSGPRANVEFILDELHLRPFFRASTCAEDTRFGKPNPEVFLLAAAKLETPPERCVVVEDSLHGLRAARAAGMKCLAITTTHSPEELHGAADRIIASFEDVTPRDFEALLNTTRPD